jgi:hypothetical protein
MEVSDYKQAAPNPFMQINFLKGGRCNPSQYSRFFNCVCILPSSTWMYFRV